MADIIACNVTLFVRNMDTSIQFYSEKLGFTLKNRYGEHWADIEAPGLAIGLHPISPGMQPGSSVSIGMRVLDLKAAMRDLTGKGITFQAADDEQVSLANFEDPDGHMLYLVQERT